MAGLYHDDPLIPRKAPVEMWLTARLGIDAAVAELRDLSGGPHVDRDAIDGLRRHRGTASENKTERDKATQLTHLALSTSLGQTDLIGVPVSPSDGPTCPDRLNWRCAPSDRRTRPPDADPTALPSR